MKTVTFNVNMRYRIELDEEEYKEYCRVDQKADSDVVAFWERVCKAHGRAYSCLEEEIRKRKNE